MILFFQATEELRENLIKLKNMYGSGIEALDDIAGELDENSKSTVGQLNNEVSKHSSALEDVCISKILFLQLKISFLPFTTVLTFS